MLENELLLIHLLQYYRVFIKGAYSAGDLGAVQQVHSYVFPAFQRRSKK